MFRLHSLGGLDLRSADGAELRAVLAQPRRLALLVYLAIERPRGFHRRDSILPLFWPEYDTERARASLNRALYFLRHALGPGAIESRGDEAIGLAPEVLWCDVRAFDQALAEGRRQAALELYRGELLPGFFASDATGFHLWLDQQRTRLRAAAAGAAWALADQEEAGQLPGPAVQWARRAAALAPFDESSLRRLLALLDRTGDRAGALVAYTRFTEDLARELEVEPSRETRALIEAIRTRSSSPDKAPARADTVVAGAGTAPPAAPGLLTRKAWGLGLAAVLALALGVALRPLPTDPIRGPSPVEIVPFANRTGNPALDRVSDTAAGQLITAIRQAGLPNAGLPPTRRTDDPAATVVSGALEREGPRVRITAWITRAGRPPWRLDPVLASGDSLPAALAGITARLLGAVAILRGNEPVLLLAGPPPAFEAYQEYLEGSKVLAQGAFDEALRRFRVAAALDPTFTWPLVQAGFSSLYARREDRTATADSLIAVLQSRQTRLPPLQLHLVNHLAAVRRADWTTSYHALRSASRIAPLHYSYQFATRALDLNRPRETAAALTRPGLDSVHRGNPFYWYVLTFALHQAGEHSRELREARRARELRPGSASAFLEEVRALIGLGRVDDVRMRLDTAAAMARESWLTTGAVLGQIATELRSHGHGGAAAEAHRLALAWYRGRPTEERESQEWRELAAEALYEAGRWPEADSLFQDLIRRYPTSYGYPDNVAYLGRLGTLAARRGDSAQARRMAERLAAMARAQPVPGQEAMVYRARIAALLGDHALSIGLLTSAYGPAGTTELHRDSDFDGMRTWPAFREFLRPKG